MSTPISVGRATLARGIAITADVIQMVLFPMFIGGAAEGADAVLDLVVAGLLISLCGFHVAFLPTMIAEALPGVDVIPSWTFATLYVTRKAALEKGAPAPSKALSKDA